MKAQEKAPARAENTEPGSNQEHPEDATDTVDGKPLELVSLEADKGPPKITIDGKPAIVLPGDDRTIGEFAGELGEELSQTEIFKFGRSVCVPNRDSRELMKLSPESFRTWIEAHVATVALPKDSNGKMRFSKKSPSADVSRATLESEAFLKRLRMIRSFAQVRMPTIRPTGELDILPAGYDSVIKIYTDPQGLEWRTDFNTERSVAILDKLLIDFPFVDARSKGVAIGAMLTVFGRHLFEPGALLPCFFFDANSEGSGKSTLASLSALPDGIPCPKSLPNNEAEIEKRLVALVKSGRRVEILDNAKGHINSPSLEGYLSAASWGGRLLGKSDEVTGEAGAVILLTGNGCTFTPDLRRRSLTCNLFVQELRAEDRIFNQSLDIPAMMRIRGPIMSCLWALIRGWDKAGRPKGTGSNASFQRWADMIGGIVEHAGYASPVSPCNVGVGGDTDTRDMQRLAGELEPLTNHTFSAIVETCRKIGAFERLVGSTGEEMERTEKSVFSTILKRFDGKMILPRMHWRIVGSGHSRRYTLSADQ